MNATFAPAQPVAGNVAFLSQSGGLGIELMSRAGDLGIGISQFVSVGNKADVSGNDLLQYWADDAQTEVILLYLESFGNPGKFVRLARNVARSKPIVAVKSGRTAVGSRAASSHTAALAAPDIAVDALFRQAGVIRVDTLDELLSTAMVLAHQPLPAGRRVAIVSNAGGPGILAADACAGAGLEVPELDRRDPGRVARGRADGRIGAQPRRPRRGRDRRPVRGRAAARAGRRLDRRGARDLRSAAGDPGRGRCAMRSCGRRRRPTGSRSCRASSARTVCPTRCAATTTRRDHPVVRVPRVGRARARSGRRPGRLAPPAAGRRAASRRHRRSRRAGRCRRGTRRRARGRVARSRCGRGGAWRASVFRSSGSAR